MHSEYKMTVKGFMGWPMAQKIPQPTKARNKYAPWSRKKVVSDLESTLIVSLIVSGSPLFCILLSAVNSLPASHPIVTIPDTQLASAWSRSGGFGRVVGDSEVIQLGIVRISPGNSEITSVRYAIRPCTLDLSLRIPS